MLDAYKLRILIKRIENIKFDKNFSNPIHLFHNIFAHCTSSSHYLKADLDL